MFETRFAKIPNVLSYWKHLRFLQGSATCGDHEKELQTKTTSQKKKIQNEKNCGFISSFSFPQAAFNYFLFKPNNLMFNMNIGPYLITILFLLQLTHTYLFLFPVMYLLFVDFLRTNVRVWVSIFLKVFTVDIMVCLQEASNTLKRI